MQFEALLIEARFQTLAETSSCFRTNQAERVMRSSGGGVALTRRLDAGVVGEPAG